LAGLDAAPSNPGSDTAPAQRQTAAPVVVPLVAVELGRALAGPPWAAARALDRRDGVDHRLQQHRGDRAGAAELAGGQQPPGHTGAQLVDDADQAGAVVDAGRPP
jgi:hypothetical protein